MRSWGLLFREAQLQAGTFHGLCRVRQSPGALPAETEMSRFLVKTAFAVSLAVTSQGRTAGRCSPL